MRTQKLLENAIETYLETRAKQEGFLCPKFKSASNNGVPDRVLVGHGLTIFVETKRPDETPRPLQKAVIQDFRNHGADVRVIDKKSKVDALFDELRPWCLEHPNADAPPEGMVLIDL